MWTLDDIKKDLEDTSNLLKHKKEKSTLGEAEIKKLEDSLVLALSTSCHHSGRMPNMH